jgi:alpha-ribazole phosphatase
MRLLIARHGVTEWNKIHRLQGQSDVPLSAEGRAEARALAARLAGVALAAVYSSDLARARETAEIVAQPHGLAVTTDAAFREVALGELEGLTRAALEGEYAEVWERWRVDPASVQYPGGESLTQVQERMWRGFEGLAAAHPHDTVLLVSHGFALLTLVCRVIDLPLRSFRRLWLDTTGVSEVLVQGERRWLRGLNDRSHLQADA